MKASGRTLWLVALSLTAFSQPLWPQCKGYVQRQEQYGERKRFFHLFPSFPIVPEGVPFQPLSSGDKFCLAVDHTFDRITPVKAAFAAAFGQAINQPTGYEQGWDAYGKRFGAATGTITFNELFSTYLFPSLLHQDPRYFRSGTGTTKQRIKYAITRIFVTRTDSGGDAFNWSYLLGTSFAAGMQNAYFPDRNRTFGDTFASAGSTFGLGAGVNVLQEFLPELERKFLKHQSNSGPNRN
jgi:hypothetical protein